MNLQKLTLQKMKNQKLKTILLVVAFAVILVGRSAQAEELPKESLYRISSEWKNQEGVPSSLKDFQGQSVVVAMTYTGCQYSCPMTLQKLEKIEAEFKKHGLKNYRFVVASFDAERDTPENLKAYMKKRKINFDKWTFLSAASDTEVRKLAVVLEISYQKIEGGDFSHSNTITLLDPVGRLAVKVPGLGSPHDELIEKAISYEKQN